jgi:hypothetical protein
MVVLRLIFRSRLHIPLSSSTDSSSFSGQRRNPAGSLHSRSSHLVDYHARGLNGIKMSQLEPHIAPGISASEDISLCKKQSRDKKMEGEWRKKGTKQEC